MDERKGTTSSPRTSGLDIVWVVISAVIGAALAFVVMAFDAATSFGNATFTRSAVVFLVSWPIGTLLCYMAVKDLKEQAAKRRDPNREVRSLSDPRTIAWIVGIVVLGFLYLIFEILG